MQTIGERLEDARKRKGLSIREAAEATKIRGDYLQKFEANQFNIGLTDIYIRGFLRNYAGFLQLPADRIVNDYSALGHADARPRQPSREVYGRMEVSVSTPAETRTSRRGGASAEAEAGGGAEPPTPAAGPAGAEAAPRPSLRPLTTVLPANRLDPALVFKALIAGVGLIMLILIVWLVRSLVGGSSPSHAAEHPALMSTPAAVPAPEAEAPVTLIATQPVGIRVTALSDGHELWAGQLGYGERHDFPNIGLHVSASAIENLEIDYKGSRFRFGGTGQRTGDVPVQH